MSAYIVEAKTINRIVGYLNNSQADHLTYCRDAILAACKIEITADWWTLLGQKMYDLNVYAVTERYGKPWEHVEGQLSGEYFKHSWEHPTRVQAFKSLSCWLYQCSEGRAVEFPIYTAFTNFQGALARHIVSTMPEFSRAVWG